MPSRASVVLFVLYSLLSFRWAALYDRERSRANPHAHGEAHLVTPYRPRGVSNTKTVLSLIFSTWCPRLRKGLLQQRRIVPECLKRRVLWGGSFPLWSFLPIGIVEHPASDSPVFGGLISLHSLSYPWVSGRRRQRLTLPPSTSSPSTVFPTCGYRRGDPVDIWVGDARDVSRWRRPSHPSGRRRGRYLCFDIDFDSCERAQGFVRAIHVALLVWLMGRSVTRLDPRGAACMDDGTFSHSTES